MSEISAGYGDIGVLRGIRLCVPAAEVVAVLGPNGAGKTTLLRVASGLLRPWSGSVNLDGVDVTETRAHERTDLGMSSVHEGWGIFPSLTVRENLRLFAKTGNIPIDGVLDQFPILGKRLRQIAGTMSGGEQQMLTLARVYLQNPRIVLLDEISMGLAPKVIEEIFVFLQGLASRGIALLIVEQYVNLALELADYVYILKKGKITFAGEPSELGGEDVFDHYVAANAW